MPDLPFPLSSTPGARAGEGGGRLINAFAEKEGETILYRRTAGLSVFATVGLSTPRGIFSSDDYIYAVYSGGVKTISSAGVVAAYTGSIPGTDGVTLFRNNKAPTPDVFAVRESGGAYVLGAGAVTPYPDPELPVTANSGTFIDGFGIFSLPDGRLFATDLNDTAVDPLSFATAEARPDGLKRVITHAGKVYAMGTSTIEPWLNNGDSPFPLLRGTTVMSVGLLTTMAVAGMEEGWDHNPYFVAHDGTVREISGYQAPVVSTPDVEAVEVVRRAVIGANRARA